MKTFRLCFTLLFLSMLLCMSGCTYHGKIHRSIYHHKDFEEKIGARVMVVSDKYFPEIFSPENTLEGYHFRLSDGLPVAVADALANLFTEVEVNEYKYRHHYDFIVEINYDADAYLQVGKYVTPNTFFPRYSVTPTLDSSLQLTVRNPQTGYAVARYDAQQSEIMVSPKTHGVVFLVHLITALSMGILYPLDVQVFGSYVRRQLEGQITHMLSKQIMPDMEEDRFNFMITHETEKTNVRVDGKFIPFMKSVVYIMSGKGIGSGFLIDPHGYIVTNAHVVENNRDVGVILYDQRQLMDKTNPRSQTTLDDMGNKVRFAKVLKVNRKRDLALIKIEGDNFPWLELEQNRSAYTTGKKVVALGAPRGIEWSVSEGIISATRDDNGRDTLQTDTAINGGNSGGPLIDVATGKVVGVNSWMQISQPDKLSLQRGTHGLNFAISSFEVFRTLGVTQPVHPDDFSSLEE